MIVAAGTCCDGGDPLRRDEPGILRTIEPRPDGYWRKIAAPLLRVRVLLRALKRFDPSALVDLAVGAERCSEQIHGNHRVSPWADWHAANLDSPVDFERLVGGFDIVVAYHVGIGRLR